MAVRIAPPRVAAPWGLHRGARPDRRGRAGDLEAIAASTTEAAYNWSLRGEGGAATRRSGARSSASATA